MATAQIVGGSLETLPLDQLEPDAWNPRLPPAVQRELLPEMELYEYVDRAYDAVSIAESIVRHGYFASEPLIAVARSAAYDESDKDAGNGRFVVVEGNRRLTALKGLASDKVRRNLKSPSWKRLPTDVELPSEIPVLILESRDKAAPILGFRHITRAAPWEPYPQSKYIVDLVDNQERSFADVADLLGRSEAEIRSSYRNFFVLEQAEQEFGLSDPSRISDSFGVFTRAMQNPEVRAFIGAPDPKDVSTDVWPLGDENKEQLERLVTWLFGEPRKSGKEDVRPPRPGQVLLDSRQITKLGRAISDSRSRDALLAGKGLEEALEELAGVCPTKCVRSESNQTA